MANRLSVAVRLSHKPVDRLASYQGEEILRSYRLGEYSFDESTGLHWMIEKESPHDFLARLFRPGSDDVIIVERTEGVVRSYKYGEDQSHPIRLGAGSPEFDILERKIRFPELLTQPHLWKRLA